MSTVVTCPRCAKRYRLGAEVPLTFSCRACGEAMDLWQYTAAARPRAAAGPARKPASLSSKIWTAGFLLAGGLLGIVLPQLDEDDAAGPSRTMTAAELDALLRARESPEVRQRRLELDSAVARLRREAARLSITAPKSNEVVGDTVHVVGALTSGLANERVLVDRVEVRKGPGPFETTVTLKPDQTYIDLTIEGPSNVISTGITVKRAP